MILEYPALLRHDALGSTQSKVENNIMDDGKPREASPKKLVATAFMILIVWLVAFNIVAYNQPSARQIEAASIKK